MRTRRLHGLPSRAVEGVPGVRVHRFGRAGPAELKLFRFEPGARTAPHRHQYPHHVVVLSGSGAVLTDAGERPIGPGGTVSTRANESHGFLAAADDGLEFLCLDSRE